MTESWEHKSLKKSLACLVGGQTECRVGVGKKRSDACTDRVHFEVDCNRPKKYCYVNIFTAPYQKGSAKPIASIKVSTAQIRSLEQLSRHCRMSVPIKRSPT